MRFPPLSSWMRGRKVEDRGRGFHPSFVSPRPVSTVIDDMNRIVDEKFGLADCPTCGLRVAVLVHGVCRDCGPEEAA